jgi:hypothetical protein
MENIETYKCAKCNHEIPITNKVLHELRCPGPSQKEENNSNENEALLTSSRLDSIISILENKFESILSYYEEIITKIKNIAFLNMIQLFLIISSKELEIIHKIFSKIEKKNDKFELKKKFLLFKL